MGEHTQGSGESVALCRRCGVRPGTTRYYAPNPLGASVAGQTPKFSVKETVGCDECWSEFSSPLSGSSEPQR